MRSSIDGKDRWSRTHDASIVRRPGKVWQLRGDEHAAGSTAIDPLVSANKIFEGTLSRLGDNSFRSLGGLSMEKETYLR